MGPAKVIKPRLYTLAAWLLLVIVTSVIIGAIAYGNSGPKPVTVAPPPTCGLSDNSFCPTLASLKSYVRTEDFSDILELEQPRIITCPNQAYQSNCVGITSQLTIQLFAVSVHGQMQLYTRNNYIAYLTQYFAASGPFVLDSDSQTGSSADVIYVNPPIATRITFQFAKTNGHWLLISPDI